MPSKDPFGQQGTRPVAIVELESEGSRDLAWLRHAHQEQLSLCKELEEIADSLPANIDKQKCIYAAKALGPLIQGVHHYEERTLFPWLNSYLSGQQNIKSTLDRLKYEHFEDECFAEELTDALLRLGSGEAANMEAIGYMLRGFFEGLRRHIAFEQEYLLQLVPQEQTRLPPI